MELRKQSWVKIDVLAKELGIASRTLRRWCQNGQIPASKLGGGQWYVSIDELRALRDEIAAQKVSPYESNPEEMFEDEVDDES